MRITIETGEEFASLQVPGQEGATMGDGGAPAGDLIADLGTGSIQQQGASGAELTDGGGPPEWLQQAITQAFEQDPERFDIGAESSDAAVDTGGPSENGDATAEAPLARAREGKSKPDQSKGEKK